MKNNFQKFVLRCLPLAILLPAFAHAKLSFVGPKDATGFPRWYKDSLGTRLTLCLETDASCLPLEDVDPARPVKFPDNFPPESFWWNGEAMLQNVSGGGQVRLIMALEAGFAREVPLEGDRVSFARVRVRARDIAAGTYRITHPFGQSIFEATSSAGRSINETADVGISNENFRGALKGDVGPFLVWDPEETPAAPIGFIGDPLVPHKVVGSPNGTNFLKVERKINGVFTTVGFTDKFNVAGKLDTKPEEPQLRASPNGGIFKVSPLITLRSSIPATIFYTLDGSDPLTSPTKITYTEPFRIADCAALRFVGQTKNAQSSVGSELYIKVP